MHVLNTWSRCKFTSFLFIFKNGATLTDNLSINQILTFTKYWWSVGTSWSASKVPTFNQTTSTNCTARRLWSGTGGKRSKNLARSSSTRSTFTGPRSDPRQRGFKTCPVSGSLWDSSWTQKGTVEISKRKSNHLKRYWTIETFGWKDRCTYVLNEQYSITLLSF